MTFQIETWQGITFILGAVVLTLGTYVAIRLTWREIRRAWSARKRGSK